MDEQTQTWPQTNDFIHGIKSHSSQISCRDKGGRCGCLAEQSAACGVLHVQLTSTHPTPTGERGRSVMRSSWPQMQAETHLKRRVGGKDQKKSGLSENGGIWHKGLSRWKTK